MDMKRKTEIWEYEKSKPWYKCITAEPSMFFYMMAFMTTSVIESTFYIFRACSVNHGYSDEICHNISSYPDINTEVQVGWKRSLRRDKLAFVVKILTDVVFYVCIKYILHLIVGILPNYFLGTVSIYQQWFGISSQLVPCVLAFFLGAYSDKRGRKGILLAGLIGKLYFSVAIIINTIFAWPVEYVIYTAVLPSALTGADVAIFAAAFAYIADVTTAANRTFRIGVLDIVYMSTMPTGVALGNFLFNNVVDKSFTIMFVINASLMVVATLYTLIFLEWQTRPEQKSLREAGVKNPITDFFDIKHLKSTYVTLTKKRHSYQRTFLWMLLIAMGFYTFQKDERPMMYLYTIATFGWGVTEFSNFRTYLTSIYLAVMLVCIPLMTKFLRWKDTLIVMIAAAAHMSGRVIYALAADGWVFFVGATAAALGPCTSPLLRSMASKVLAPNEKGVAYAFLSVMQIAVGMFAAVIYSQIYNAALRNDGPLNVIFYFTLATQAVVFLIALSMEILLKGRRLEDAVANQEKAISEDS